MNPGELRIRLRRGSRVRVMPYPEQIYTVADFGPYGPLYLIEPEKWIPKRRAWETKREFNQIVEIIRDRKPLPLP